MFTQIPPTIFFHLASEKRTVKRTVIISLIIGLILNLINQPELLTAFSFQNLNIVQILLTFMIPYGVSTYSTILSNYTVQPGQISKLDANFQCKRCKKADFRVRIGELIEECPQCQDHTRWKPLMLFSKQDSDQELIKSLALFARYNPQPLFRINKKSSIIGANPKSEELLGHNDLAGKELKEFIPEVGEMELEELIKKEQIKHFITSISDNYYTFVFKGLSTLDSIHVYGTDITQIIRAEEQIKKQAGEIQSSIHYASRIQSAMLPESKMIQQVFPNHFIFYRPKNTVSGDFFWINQISHFRIAIAADCTGHGVPGAFMSMMGISLLNEIILREEKLEADEILNKLRQRLISSLETKNAQQKVQDGLDISLAIIDDQANMLYYAGAFNPLYLLRDKQLSEITADRMPIGRYIHDTVPFSQKSTSFEHGDRIILFTDGYKDQYGGKDNKKISSRRFKNLLTDSSNLPVQEQLAEIESFFDQWKGNQEQIDDVLVMGIEL
jgi:serine phosphatase RsbU (regulator of sigma subunit)